MRITSGFAKGMNLKVPKITDIRPAQEVARLAVFSMLADHIADRRILELYAGSGAYGLEALSRGAKHATFIDNNPLAIKAIEDNLQHARFWGKARVERHDALRYLMDSHEVFDVIFLAPPYAYGIPKPLLYHLAEHLTDDGLVIYDHAKSSVFPVSNEHLTVTDQRTYGATAITILRHK
jgi:16S rRNA (guanine966-N2)-methyltransferase